MRVIVYVSVGNSHDRLTQAEWHDFHVAMRAEVVTYAAVIHGEWFSDPVAKWQNASWCLEFDSNQDMIVAKKNATRIRTEFRQESVAWATAATEFI